MHFLQSSVVSANGSNVTFSFGVTSPVHVHQAYLSIPISVPGKAGTTIQMVNGNVEIRAYLSVGPNLTSDFGFLFNFKTFLQKLIGPVNSQLFTLSSPVLDVFLPAGNLIVELVLGSYWVQTGPYTVVLVVD